MSSITAKQIKILKSFSCERLRDNDDNQKLIKEFSNSRGYGIVNSLLTDGWEEDTNGSTAYYLIKFDDGDIALFFSIQCGSLFDPMDEENIKNNVNQKTELLDKVEELYRSVKKPTNGTHIKRIHVKALGNYINNIRNNIKDLKDKLYDLDTDRNVDKNSMLIRVKNTYSGIELKHFCVNDAAREKWSKYNITRPIGEVLYWHFIVPIIYEIQDKIGCEYFYLFAADRSDDEVLVNYYNVTLKFEKTDKVGTNKPVYDYGCVFMCQRIDAMKEHRDKYFNVLFNPDDETPDDEK